MMDYLYGRALLKQEIPEKYWPELAQADVKTLSGVIEQGGKWLCRRCQSVVQPIEPNYCLTCGEAACGYCTQCLQMGKVKRCSTFYYVPEPNKFPPLSCSQLAWQGTLSEQQAVAAQDIIETIQQRQTRLLWAVAGAGKTEMLFKGIDYALQQGLRIGLASPRVDVCLELAPRLQSAFPDHPVALLYGDMEEPYQYRQLTIATTHQLFRFQEAFDVLIIDEIDAFPYHNDRALQTATQKARKPESALIYLSATPDQRMQRQVKQGKLLATILPARYHAHPLPIPIGKRCGNWETALLNGTTNAILKKMTELLNQNRCFLVFVPNIQWVLKWEQQLLETFPEATFEVVYSSDPERKEKVLKMREGKLDFLISTTILERGVTFKNIDVLVVGSDDRIFTESSLVQIAGRAGRSPQFPTGDVIYYYTQWTKAMKRAIKQIKTMNQLARKRGLISDD